MHKFGLIPRNWLLNTVYQEVVSLPFSSEPQGTISKNSFLCFMNIVTCDRGVGRGTQFIHNKRL
ncbi:hypothetical protein D4T53_00395 [Enterococcus faecium]|nr:hypothetical protein [Enterococcus faecium]EGP5501150.1 hypothetical protein [Enterococcus faecium]